jgi:hypothetical protein
MLRRLDMLRLRALVATAKQNDDRIPPRLKIDTVAGAVVDAQFADTFANRLDVACVPLGEPIEREAIIARARWSLSRKRHFRNVSVCLSSIARSL